MHANDLRTGTLAFLAAHRDGEEGAYRYAAGSTAPTLYASCYAAMTRHLLDDLDGLPAAGRKAWVAYLQAYQDDDGLFRDPVIFDQGWWPLFFYDGLQPPHLERALDTILATQNPLGGFGWGVHNPSAPFLSSACEDIDSIDPLCRISRLTAYRRTDVEAALAKAGDWVLTNRTSTGGFVFLTHQPCEYGHMQLRSEAGEGAMFPTWFRLLSLALIGRTLPEHPLGRLPWRFVRCPGMQF